MNQYETVFILTPVLSDVQMKEAADKFVNYLKDKGAEIISTENWGLKALAYPIQKKTSGFYQMVEFKAEPTVIAKLELQMRRDERVLRYLTVKNCAATSVCSATSQLRTKSTLQLMLKSVVTRRRLNYGSTIRNQILDSYYCRC